MNSYNKLIWTICTFMLVTVVTVSSAQAQNKPQVVFIGHKVTSSEQQQLVKPIPSDTSKDVIIKLKSDNDILVMLCSSSEIVVFQHGKLAWHSITSEQSGISTPNELDQSLTQQKKTASKLQRFKATRMQSVAIPSRLSCNSWNAMTIKFSEIPSSESYTLDGRPLKVRFDPRQHYWSIVWEKAPTASF